MEIDIISSEGKKTGKAQLPVHLAGNRVSLDEIKVNRHLLHEVVQAYLANQRKGTHSTLTRGHVGGSGKKPWKQKHTGRARAGSSKSPLWKGGGIIFGPHPRSYRRDLPHSKVRSALSQILAEKARRGDVIVSEKPNLESAKTKQVAEWIKRLSLPVKSLLVIEQKDEKLVLASRNMEEFHVISSHNLHPYHLLKARKIVLTPGAVKSLGEAGAQ